MAKIGLGLSDYWLIIRKRKWIAIVSFLAVFLSSVISVRMQTPVYQAICSIRIIERKSVSDLITQMVSSTSYDLMKSLPKVLNGRPIIEKVVYELGLADENTPKEKLESIILGLQGAVQATDVEGTNIIKIAAFHKDPKMAAGIANAVAKTYAKSDAEEKNENAHNMRIFLEDQLAKCRQRLNEVERMTNSLRASGAATGIAVIIQDGIAALEKEKLGLRKIYTEKYPDVVKINEQIGNLNERLKTLPKSEIEYANLTRDLEVNDRAYRELQIKLQDARIAEAEKSEDVRVVNPATVPKAPIKPNKALADTMGFAVALVIGVFASFVVETLDTSIGTIDDLQSLLKLPVLSVIPYMKSGAEEKKPWFWLPWRLRALYDQAKRSSPENTVNMRNQILLKYPQRSSTTEAYRILRTNIKAGELKKSNKTVLLITSTIPKEGKSITATNLAIALAQDGYRTLLIDCDLRKAIIHKLFNLNKEPGLTDVLLGTAKVEDATRNFIDMMIDKSGIGDILNKSGVDNFSILTCGTIVDNPTEMLDSAKVEELFSFLKARYDFLVVDSPPILPVSDAIILGTKVADKVYLVYRSGYTAKSAILRAKEQLEMMKVSPAGIILNSTSPESELVSDYYHHYYHYRYYSDEEEAKKGAKS